MTSVPTVVAPPRTRWWAVLLAGAGLAVLVGIVVASVLPATLVAEKVNTRLNEVQEAPFARAPATAESVNQLVEFGQLPDDVQRFDTAGDFYFVTVIAPEQSLLSYLAGRGNPAIDLLTFEDKFGFQTPTQQRAIALQQMRTAEQEAQYVALTKVGYDPTIRSGEVVVGQVLCREPNPDGSCAVPYPSDEFIDPADTILEADGEPLDTLDDLLRALDGKDVGDEVELLIDRPDVGELTVDVELSAAPDDPDRAIIGFIPFDTSTVELPFELDIDTRRIGGPSAGLAFTLALIDELTAGELTGGRNIAVTGTIGLDGRVGPIGGLVQKVSAVKQHGVDVFLVPASQAELADPEQRARLDAVADGQVELIPVATLDEALEVLERLGGDPIQTVS